jgi:uncharacterized protein (TIGR04222 family)
MNPFNLRAPEFLTFYVLFGLGILLWLRWQRWSREPSAPSPLPSISDPYSIAFLRGGRNSLLEVATLSLIDRGLLNANDGTLLTQDRHAAKLAGNKLDRALLEYFATPAKAITIYTQPCFTGPMSDMDEKLKAEHLLPDYDLTDARLRDFGIAVLVLASVATIKVLIALERGRKFGFLILIAIGFMVAAYKVACPRRTRQGDTTVADLRTLMASLLGRAGSLIADQGSQEVLMLAAVFGVAALPATSFPYLPQLFPGSGGNSSSSSGGSGSSCGSSCGGGGGGCGGCGS